KPPGKSAGVRQGRHGCEGICLPVWPKALSFWLFSRIHESADASRCAPRKKDLGRFCVIGEAIAAHGAPDLIREWFIKLLQIPEVTVVRFGRNDHLRHSSGMETQTYVGNQQRSKAKLESVFLGSEHHPGVA